MKSGFYVDARALQEIQSSLKATYAQTNMAYNRALDKTLRKLQVNSLSMMREVTGAKDKKSIDKRVKTYVRHPKGTNKRMPAAGRIWFGLNDMPVSALKGTMKNPPGAKAKNRKRDERGRFLPGRGARGATFNPKSAALASESYPGGFVTTVRGKRSIFMRVEGKSYLREAKIPVSDAVEAGISSDIFADAGETLMELFTKELKGLVKRGYKG